MENTKVSLTEEIFAKLKDEIVQVRLKQGELLTESELAQRFNVSKTPVREALTRLKGEGFVEILPYKGYLVTGISVGDLQNIFQFRLILELASTELAVKYATDEELNGLEKLARESFVLDDEESITKYNGINYQFHIQMAQICRNPLLVSSLSNVLNQLRRVLLLDLKTTHAEEISRSHRQLIELIRERKKEEVIEQVRKHIMEAEQRIYSHRVRR